MPGSETDRWATTSRAVLDRLRAGDRTDLAVVTVVDVDGRAYRRPGAKMLVDAAGETVGSVTPGCLEGPLVDVAADVLDRGTPRVETYDLTDDDGWGLGLGCQGIVTVLVEPADESIATPVGAVADGAALTVITALDGADGTVGARTVVAPDGTVAGESEGGVVAGSEGREPLPEAVLRRVAGEAAELAGEATARTRTVATDSGEVTVLLDGLAPPHRLLVFGSQPDVRPVARIARQAGFVVCVATARGAHADDARFPAADRVVATAPEDLADLVDDRTAAVLMSHNFVDDRLALGSLLDSGVPYIGLMGPRKRFRRLRDDLRDEGVELSAADRERIAAPVGLDLGGGEPAEIALSVVAEALAALNGRSGGRLSERSGPIHDRIR